MNVSTKASDHQTLDLNRLVIKSPCPMDWDLMEGDDSARFCSKCYKHVYNLSGLTQQQAGALIASKGEELCGRIFRRPDGTIVTAECAPQSATRARPYQFTIATLIFLITTSAALFAAMPLVGRVIGPVVERWFAKPIPNNQLSATMGVFVMGEVECIYELPLDEE